MPANSTWPPPVEIGTKRSSSTALRIVQGATTRRPRPAGSPPAPAPWRQSARARRAKTTSASRKAIARYSGRTIAVAPSSGSRQQPGTPTRSIRRPEHRQDRAGQQGRRQRLAHQHPLVLEQRRINRHRGRAQPGPPQRLANLPAHRRAKTPGMRGGGRAGRRRGRRGCRGAPGASRAVRSCDASRHLVEPGDQQRQARRVVARGLRRARTPTVKPSPLLEVGGDRRVGGGVVDGRPSVPGLAHPQAEPEQEDRDEDGEADPATVSRRQSAFHRADSTRTVDRSPGRPTKLPRPMRILILGGDGYLGWPTALQVLGPRPRGLRRRQLLAPPLARGSRHRLADADRRPRRSGSPPGRRARGRGDPQLRRLGRGRRLPRRRRRRDPARGGRPLRPAGLGPLLDGLAREGGRDPARERDRQPQPALRDPRPRSRLPPGQARDDGRVRPARHRHRGGLHRDRAQGAPATRCRSRSCRPRCTTARRSTTRPTSTSPAAPGACAPPTSTRASSTGSRPRRPPATSA